MEEKESIQDGLYLVKTKLGWMISGRVSNQSKIRSKISTNLLVEVVH